MNTTLIIFDLDGTLIDSSVDISNALNYAVEPFGLGPVSLAETITLVGEGVTKLVTKLLERRGRHVKPSVLVDRFLEHYSAHFADYTRPYPGTEETLEALAEFKKVIISNKLEALSLQVLEALNLQKYFDYVAGGDTTPEKKPSPEPVLKVLSRFATPPEAALLVGDSIYDMEAGRSAGVRTVAASYGFGAPGFSRNANYEIDSIERLIDLVKTPHATK